MILLKVLNKILDVVGVILFVAMFVVVLLQILFRTVLKTSVPWTEEMSRLLFIYVGFLGTALAAREKQFIIIDVLLKRLPKIVQNFLYFFIKVFCLFFFCIMWYGAVRMFMKVKGTFFFTMSWLSNGWTYIALIVGLFFTVFYIVIECIDEIRHRGEGDKANG